MSMIKNFARMQHRLLACVLVSASILVTAEGNADSDYLIKNRVIPEQYSRAGSVFELLKWSGHENDAFNADQAPHWDVDSVMKFISKDGVTFSDVNDSSKIRISKEEIKKELLSRKGRAFLAISHFSFIYSIPYKQYSELTFSDTKTGFNVDMAGIYAFDFESSNGTAYLVSVDHTELEGD